MEHLVRVMANHWWVPLLRGIAAILFGLLALVWPGLTVYVLLVAFGVYAVIDGVMAIIISFRRRSFDENWWAWLVEGLLSLIIGVMAMAWPKTAALALIIWMAAWAIVAGVFRIVEAIRLRREIDGEWMLILSGLLSVLWGALMIYLPAAGLLSIAWLIGSFAIAIGVTMIVLAFRLRRIKNDG